MHIYMHKHTFYVDIMGLYNIQQYTGLEVTILLKSPGIIFRSIKIKLYEISSSAD
jgi:hypothetical protein